MTFREVVLAINGLRDRDIMIQAMYRRMTAIIASTNMGGSKVASKINKLWPLSTESISVLLASAEALRLPNNQPITAVNTTPTAVNSTAILFLVCLPD